MRTIRKEIVINAPPAKVWEHITDPAKIAGWLMDNSFQATVGRKYTMEHCEHGDLMGQISGVVTEAIPNEKLVYTWTSQVIKVQTTVTITLTEEKGRTRLVLEHSGWEAPPADQTIPDTFDKGWSEHLKALQDQIAEAGK
jgi:uncharacterized protein YndB with AHSA1/START domain